MMRMVTAVLRQEGGEMILLLACMPDEENLGKRSVQRRYERHGRKRIDHPVVLWCLYQRG